MANLINVMSLEMLASDPEHIQRAREAFEDEHPEGGSFDGLPFRLQADWMDKTKVKPAASLNLTKSDIVYLAEVLKTHKDKFPVPGHMDRYIAGLLRLASEGMETTEGQINAVIKACGDLTVAPVDPNGSFYNGNRPFYLIDTSKADYEVNYPGDLVSEHPTRDEAIKARARAIIEAFLNVA